MKKVREGEGRKGKEHRKVYSAIKTIKTRTGQTSCS